MGRDSVEILVLHKCNSSYRIQLHLWVKMACLAGNRDMIAATATVSGPGYVTGY